MTFLSLSFVILICAPSLATGKGVLKTEFSFQFFDPDIFRQQNVKKTTTNQSFIGKRTVKAKTTSSDYKLEGSNRNLSLFIKISRHFPHMCLVHKLLYFALINQQSCIRTLYSGSCMIWANHFKSSQLNPPITTLMTIAIVTNSKKWLCNCYLRQLSSKKLNSHKNFASYSS